MITKLQALEGFRKMGSSESSQRLLGHRKEGTILPTTVSNNLGDREERLSALNGL
jgi:hypothetical protein